MELWIRGVTPEPFGLQATVLRTRRRRRLASDSRLTVSYRAISAAFRCGAGKKSISMRVLIAGATGAVGHRLVPLLVAAGHQVTGLTRTSAKTAEIERAGATALVADAFDGPLVRRLVLEARPEVVVHEMTALANASDLTHFDSAFAMTNRLRTEGLDHLLAAARETGARRVVAQSFCGWPYARTGNPVKTEEEPLDPNPPREFRNTLDAIRHWKMQSRARRAWKALSSLWRLLRAVQRIVRRADDRSAPAAARASDRRRWRLVVVSPSRRRGCRDALAIARGAPASTTSWMMTPRRFGNGFRRSPRCSEPSPVAHPALDGEDRSRRPYGRHDDGEPCRVQSQGPTGIGLVAGSSLLAKGFRGGHRSSKSISIVRSVARGKTGRSADPLTIFHRGRQRSPKL